MPNNKVCQYLDKIKYKVRVRCEGDVITVSLPDRIQAPTTKDHEIYYTVTDTGVEVTSSINQNAPVSFHCPNYAVSIAVLSMINTVCAQIYYNVDNIDFGKDLEKITSLRITEDVDIEKQTKLGQLILKATQCMIPFADEFEEIAANENVLDGYNCVRSLFLGEVE